MTLIRGAWLDLPPSIALRDETLAWLRGLRLDEIAVMIDRPKPGLDDGKWKLRDLELFARATQGWGIKRIATICGTPTRQGTVELRARLPEIVLALQTQTIETDDEEWVFKRPHSGYVSLDAFAGDRATAILATPGVAIHEVTLYPSLVRAAMPIFRHAHRLLDQVYAVDRRRSADKVVRPVDYDGPQGPARHPREQLQRAQRELEAGGCGHIEAAAGLAVYHQAQWARVVDGERVAVADVTAMQAALSSAEKAGARRVRWWSLRHARSVERRAKWIAELAPHCA